ncbi:MAG: alanyl-tRNA editing protein [Gemmatimonadota bacterium]
MTERLYYADATLLEFDATVIAHDGDAQHVVLDRTAFYPTSGGQPHDTGTLGHARVIDVIDEGERIVHLLDGTIPLGPVRGHVDAARRTDHMQQHTAQHLLSALAADRLRWATTSVHFGTEHSTIEFDVDQATDDQLDQLEQWTQDVVALAVPVHVTFEDGATATGLRKPPPREGELRVVTIEGIDRSACGGTHVANTAALGPVRLRGAERIRGQVRVAFLAGGRAMAHLRARDAQVHALARALSCGEDELAELVPKRQQELLVARGRVETLERELAQHRLAQLVAVAPVRADGLRVVEFHTEAESAAVMRAMTQAVAGMERVLFVASTSLPPSLHLGASTDSGIDAGMVLKAALATVGGRGGGSARAAQGVVTDATQLPEVIRAVLTAGGDGAA